MARVCHGGDHSARPMKISCKALKERFDVKRKLSDRPVVPIRTCQTFLFDAEIRSVVDLGGLAALELFVLLVDLY